MGSYDEAFQSSSAFKAWQLRQSIALREWAEKESLHALEQMQEHNEGRANECIRRQNSQESL